VTLRTALALAAAALGLAARAAEQDRLTAENLAGMALRSIGPAAISGRIGDLAVHPTDPAIWWIAAASGGLWKTENAGTTWKPVFDAQGSYSIGCVTVDPRNPLTVWVGTGENNGQRSVSFGDGVYRSDDGGHTWARMGLERSEHVARIAVDPRDSRRVLVAAQGPLWAAGGDRGLYETRDGGRSWKRILHVDDDTGVTDLALDPRDPDVLYAASWQRRRQVWGVVGGGPGSGLWKSTDGGASWKRLERGLPKEELGRIGIALAPSRPDVVYAVIEARGKAGGFYRSTDGGGSWERRGDYVSKSPQYYQELFVDPRHEERVYSMDTWMMVTDDGGKTFRKVGERWKHVDNHVLWIDPRSSDHLLAGCDGGLYESFDRGATWRWFANLPLAQFYRVSVDEGVPYRIYGGTQDNGSLGGPSRTQTAHGITNADWSFVWYGDGFQSRVDPRDPNVVYAQAQYGELVRHDRRTGESTVIRPTPAPADPPLRWNWDSPLVLSPHGPTRLWFAAQRIFRSDDRGDTWEAVSPDLSRQLDRNVLRIMGRVWSVDAVAKNQASSFWGSVVALDESPLQPGLLAAGTDDGLVQVTEDGGRTWRRIERFPGVPERTPVSRLLLSRHERAVLWAAFDGRQAGDFKPYLLRSTDLGRSWTAATGGLPERNTVWSLAEDHVRRELLFAGTEFGLFATFDGGGRWVKLQGGLPPIQVRDLALQRREGDLVAATFGRGFYVLDDYAPLRAVTPALLEREAVLFAPRPAAPFVPAMPLGTRGKGSLGDAFYAADDPPAGALFTWWLRDEVRSRQKARQEREKEAAKKGGDTPYPPWEALRAEDREEEPALLLVVGDEAGNVVRRLPVSLSAGFQRAAWDLRLPPPNPTALKPPELDPWDEPPRGPLAAPGTYRAQLVRRLDGVAAPVGEPVTFEARPPSGSAALAAAEREALLAFHRRAGALQRAVLGAQKALEELLGRTEHLRRALDDAPRARPGQREAVVAARRKLLELKEGLSGDETRTRRQEPAPLAVAERVAQVVDATWFSTGGLTATQREDYRSAAAAFGPWLQRFRGAAEELRGLDAEAEAAGAPWTPGRVPEWRDE